MEMSSSKENHVKTCRLDSYTYMRKCKVMLTKEVSVDMLSNDFKKNVQEKSVQQLFEH